MYIGFRTEYIGKLTNQDTAPNQMTYSAKSIHIYRIFNPFPLKLISVSNIAAFLDISYNCLLALYLYVKIKGSLFNKKLNPYLYHGIILTFAFIAIPVFLASYPPAIGVNIFGTCSFKQNDVAPYASVLMCFITVGWFWSIIW